MKILSIEGNTQMLDGGAMFGNAPKAMWQKWVTVDSLNRIPLACRALLLKDYEGKNILFEAGIGAFFSPQLKERYGVVESEHVLLQSLQQHGLADADIDIVVLSHLHFDHAGGLLSAYQEGIDGTLLFPKAQFYVGKEQWQRALNPHPRDKASYIPLLNKLLAQSGRLHLLEKDAPHVLQSLITMHFFYGHTPGLMLAEIKLPDAPLFFASDLIPGFAWMHIPISMGYDRFPELVIEEKKATLTELLAKKARIFFTHDPKYPFGTINSDPNGKFYAQEFNYE